MFYGALTVLFERPQNIEPLKLEEEESFPAHADIYAPYRNKGIPMAPNYKQVPPTTNRHPPPTPPIPNIGPYAQICTP